MQTTCWYCENTLSPGESYWSIQASRESREGDRVEIESEAVWLTLCSACADTCNLDAGPDIEWQDGRLTLLLAHDARAAEPDAPAPKSTGPSRCPHCGKGVVAGHAFCMACGGALQ